MRRMEIGFGAVIALFLAGCGQPAASGDDAGNDRASDVGFLEGVVVDEAIRPLSGINVSLSDGRFAVTGTDGTFAFPDTAAGVYVLRATGVGYADSVTTVTVLASEPTPLVKVVLISDPSTLAYADVYVHEGFVQCSMYWDPGGYRFAACGTGNVGSLLVCNASGGAFCLGNVTDDRYITVLTLSGTPQWLQTESAWDSTQPTGDEFYILIGSATHEQLSGTPPGSSVYNDTRGPSPLLVTMNAEDLIDSGIGAGAYFMSQTFAAGSDQVPTCGTVPVCAGAVVQQPFRMILHAFFGYDPPEGWRFSEDPETPTPP